MPRRYTPHHLGRGSYQTPALLKFVTGIVAREDRHLKDIRTSTPRRGIPAINIGPDEGKLLDFLVRSCRAVKAVEVGTLAGYSACWIARALPSYGVLHTLEFDPHHAEVARENLKKAGVGSKVRIHVGPAAKSLKALASSGPFDFCFIDADKVSYPEYLRWAVRHVRSGGIVVGDNAYLWGKLHKKPASAGSDKQSVSAMRRFMKGLADTRHFSSCAMIPTGEGMAVGIRR